MGVVMLPWREAVAFHIRCSVISDYGEIVKKLQEGLEWTRANMKDTQEEKLEARYCVIHYVGVGKRVP